MQWVLHDWSDEECIQILKKCREAISNSKENGRVIIVEAVIEGEGEGEGGKHDGLKDVGLMLDMVMMAHTNFGKERTLKEWEYVIKMAGFSSYTVKPIIFMLCSPSLWLLLKYPPKITLASLPLKCIK